MQLSPSAPAHTTEFDGELRIGFIWMIAFVAAMGGLLFGYDWVVIGGAKPFYEAYFHLDSAAEVGWANSCALVGCFVGSLLAGRMSDRLGRKKVLIFSALLFAASSILTGWSYTFALFIAWRITGGIAIGLASNVSPMYIAEISPAAWRGRLVSLNQLALVVGILAAQIANWKIAERVPEHATAAMLAASWNVQYGWRWMFTAVAVPATIFLVTTPLIPESPRWLVARGNMDAAGRVLARIGGERYSVAALAAVSETLGVSSSKRDWRAYRSPNVRRLLLIGIALAVLQQWSGINILFNYAEEVYRSAGYGVNDILFNIVVTGTINLIFTVVAMLLVDRFGRRRLMLLGCLGVGASHIAASFAYRQGLQGTWVLILTLCAIACYAMSLAPVTWVLITEIFPNRVRATSVSISVAALWVSSFALTYSFPLLNKGIGTAGTFLTYGTICFLGAGFVFFMVPETKGKSLEEIEYEESVVEVDSVPTR
ncbi:MAG: sugar porter family MFS transporter [Acidobacteriaceae bacterium]|nr:sugar porter family MFS transporter [Acidobacteriaceae bacterium]